jgi:hypothetical protein
MLRLLLVNCTVCSQVSDTADGVALDFDIRAEHLTDQGLEATELDDQELVLRCVAAA